MFNDVADALFLRTMLRCIVVSGEYFSNVEWTVTFYISCVHILTPIRDYLSRLNSFFGMVTGRGDNMLATQDPHIVL